MRSHATCGNCRFFCDKSEKFPGLHTHGIKTCCVDPPRVFCVQSGTRVSFMSERPDVDKDTRACSRFVEAEDE